MRIFVFALSAAVLLCAQGASAKASASDPDIDAVLSQARALSSLVATPESAPIVPEAAAEAPASPIETASSTEPAAAGSWICNAYGLHSGARSTWRTVTGARRPTRKQAHDNAMAYCGEQLSFCRESGCWFN